MHPLLDGERRKNMKANICTTQDQSARLFKCGVSTDTADMMFTPHNTLSTEPYKEALEDRGYIPAWSLSRLLSLLPFKIPCGNFEFWLDVAPINFGTQWSIGYYCMEKPKVIKGLTRAYNLIECAVQEIEWLSANGHNLKGGTDGED